MVAGSVARPVAAQAARADTRPMPSSLTAPAGLPPRSGDETFSPLRRWRNDHEESVADRRGSPPGPVLVGRDVTPEAAAHVRRAVACAADRRVAALAVEREEG